MSLQKIVKDGPYYNTSFDKRRANMTVEARNMMNIPSEPSPINVPSFPMVQDEYDRGKRPLKKNSISILYSDKARLEPNNELSESKNAGIREIFDEAISPDVLKPQLDQYTDENMSPERRKGFTNDLLQDVAGEMKDNSKV